MKGFNFEDASDAPRAYDPYYRRPEDMSMRHEHEFSSGGITQGANAPSTAPVLAQIGERNAANLAHVIHMAEIVEKLVDHLCGLRTEKEPENPRGNAQSEYRGRFEELLGIHEQISFNLTRVDRALARLANAVG